MAKAPAAAPPAVTPPATPPAPPTPPAAVALTGPSHDPVRTRPALYYTTLGLLALFYLIMGWALGGRTFTLAGETYDAGILALWMGLLHFVLGARLVDRTHVAGVLVFGIPTIELSGFIVIVPALIFRLVSFSLAPIEIRIPADPAKVWRGTKEEKWPDGFEEPLRVPFAGKEYKDLSEKDKNVIVKDDPLLKRATEEVTVFVRLVIRQASARNEYGFFDFLVRVGSYKNAREQVKAGAISKINEDLTKFSLAEVLVNLEGHNDELQAHLEKLVRSWGVDIPTAKITVQLSHSMNSAIEGIPQAQAAAQATIAKAEGERKRLTLEGEGRGAATKAELTGKGKGQKKQMDELGVTDPGVIIAAEVADSIAAGTNEKIVVLGAESLTGLAAGLASKLSAPPAAKTP